MTKKASTLRVGRIEAAEFLGIGFTILERVVKEGKITCEYAGDGTSEGDGRKHMRFTLEELNRFKKVLREEAKVEAATKRAAVGQAKKDTVS